MKIPFNSGKIRIVPQNTTAMICRVLLSDFRINWILDFRFYNLAPLVNSMNRIIRFLRENGSMIRIMSLFVVTTLILIILFPRVGRFRYEFQKGRPWMHDDYIAPFDFPLYKSDAVLQHEKDSILNEFRPYFNKDIMVREEQLKNFSAMFENQWQRYITDNRNAIRGTGSFTGGNTNRDKSGMKEFIVSRLEFVYSKGIVNAAEIPAEYDQPDLSIVVLVEHLAKEKPYSEVFTQKTAYEFLVNQLGSKSDSLPFSKYQPFLRMLKLEDVISVNLVYDKETSERVKTEMMNSLSLTQGMVQSGERVIARGELVTAAKFRILESLKKEYERNLGFSDRFNLISIGKIILIVISMAILYLFLYNFRPEILVNLKQLTFLLLLVLIVSSLASLIIRYELLNIYILPLAIVPIMIKTFFDARLALFVHMLTVLIIGFWAPNGFEFVYLSIVAGIVSLFSLTNSYRRGILFLTAILIFLVYSLVYTSFSVIQEGKISSIDLRPLLWFAGNGFLVLTSYPLIFIFEKSFGFLSESTLLELSDSNQPLLRLLAEKAPGTFQHSMQVANLSEEVIHQTGGNPLLIRTAALYHDIGKMEHPQYFIENQQDDYNPHSELSFKKSAEMIISHVTKGVETARKHNLPEAIIEFIRTHHGTTMVQYFYKSYMKTNPGEEADLSQFTYPGPKPYTRETAVLMMADAVEAASRSLKVKNAETINDLVEKIIDHQIEQQQFDHADITFSDVTRIKEIFKKKLKDIYHYRIEYPE